MELKEVLEQKLNSLGDQIDAKINASTEAQKSNLKNELDSLKQSEIAKLTSDYAEMQKQLNAIDVKTNRIKGGDIASAKTFDSALFDAVNNNAQFKSFLGRES